MNLETSITRLLLVVWFVTGLSESGFGISDAGFVSPGFSHTQTDVVRFAVGDEKEFWTEIPVRPCFVLLVKTSFLWSDFGTGSGTVPR